MKILLKPSTLPRFAAIAGVLVGPIGVFYGLGTSELVSLIALAIAPFAMLAGPLVLNTIEEVPLPGDSAWTAGWLIAVALGSALNGLAWSAIVRIIVWARQRQRLLFLLLLIAIGSWWTWLAAFAVVIS